MTPPEVARIGAGAPDTPGWQVRVVPEPLPGRGPGARHTRRARGDRAVTRARPPARRALARRGDRAVLTLRDRAAHHLDAGFVHAQPLVNHGRASGASIEHPHAQLVASRSCRRTSTRCSRRFANAGRDLVADAIESARGGACLVRDAGAVSWCPPASHVAVLRADRAPGSGGAASTAAPTTRCARSPTRSTTRSRRLHRVLGEIAYNVVVNTAPRDDPRPFHCWIDIVPRLGVIRRLRDGHRRAGQPGRARDRGLACCATREAARRDHDRRVRRPTSGA